MIDFLVGEGRKEISGSLGVFGQERITAKISRKSYISNVLVINGIHAMKHFICSVDVWKPYKSSPSVRSAGQVQQYG